jgi:hypothetical protein
VSINDDVSHFVYILIHTISFAPRPTIEVNIHNRCSDVDLRFGAWFNTGLDWNWYFDEEVDAGSMMSVKLTPFLSTSGSILTYKLQSEHGRFGNQPESTYIQLFIVWKYEVYKELRVCTHLVECDEYVRWNEAKLEEYYQRYANQLSTYTGPIRDTWLMHDNRVLMTVSELYFTQSDSILNITISESVEDEHSKRPKRIDPEM